MSSVLGRNKDATRVQQRARKILQRRQHRHSNGHMHTDSLCTGSMPSESVAPIYAFHLITYLSPRPWPRRYRPPRHVARSGLSIERPPIRPVFRAHTRSSPCSSGAPSRSGVGTSIPDRPAVAGAVVPVLLPRPEPAPVRKLPALLLAVSLKIPVIKIREKFYARASAYP